MRIYYQDAEVTLYHGDCREVLPQLGAELHPELAGLAKVRVNVITDPPYSEHVHGKSRRGGPDAPPLDGRGRRPRASFSRTKDLGFGALTPELRQFAAQQFGELASGWVLVFSDVESDHLWRQDLIAAELDYVRTGFWEKAGGTPQFSGDRPATAAEAITVVRSAEYALDAVLARIAESLGPEAHETILIALEDAASLREPTAFGEVVIAHPKGRKRWGGRGSHAMWRVPIALNRDKKSERRHPTEKPLALMEALVDLFTGPGELVLDPFAGSGTTLRAAKNLGRKAIGVELDEKWCEAAAKRLREPPTLSMFAPRAQSERPAARQATFDLGIDTGAQNARAEVTPAASRGRRKRGKASNGTVV